ncbi:MAG: hypothetical protein EXS10_03530 [Phycisphaerales bacterium]|nr:hypothetical protein [Phycisphaerales bacterium]
MRSRNSIASLTVMTALGCTSASIADVAAHITSPTGASVTITATLSITTALGTSSDSDTKVVLTSGNAQTTCGPNAPPFNTISMTELLLDPANVSFHFDLYCFPFIGCQPLDVLLTDFSMLQIGTCTSPIINSVCNCPNMEMLLIGNYATTGVATASGALNGTVSSGVGARVQALAKQTLRLDQLAVAPMMVIPDPAQLPAGVTAMTITITPVMGAFSMSGHYVGVNPNDLNGDGWVDAADLAILLSQWGGAGSADFDANGVVGANDLASLLNAWS